MPKLGLFDLDRQILQDNLYEVDLNPELVEITKLSLWLKTARRDKPLNNLDGNIRCGNSLVEPPAPDSPPALIAACAALPAEACPFAWRAAFPAVFARGGFDVVIGNPPYVRQELLGGYKPYLAQRYATFSGVTDLYVYFYERGLELLAPDGKLSYIVTNKWASGGGVNRMDTVAKPTGTYWRRPPPDALRPGEPEFGGIQCPGNCEAYSTQLTR